MQSITDGSWRGVCVGRGAGGMQGIRYEALLSDQVLMEVRAHVYKQNENIHALTDRQRYWLQDSVIRSAGTANI